MRISDVFILRKSMNKIKSQIQNRKEFVKLSIDDPKKASKLLIVQAEALKDTRDLGGTIEVLSRLLYLSKQTIYQDIARG